MLNLTNPRQVLLNALPRSFWNILFQVAEIKPYYKFDSFDVSLESEDVAEDDTETDLKSVVDVVDLRESVPSDTIEDNIIETDIVSAVDTEEVEDTTDPAIFQSRFTCIP